ncbi:DUF6770 family protein [Myroides indicus]|uniref:WG repeat protein n=1 Tax=Myroides indicus TaxID=1323422 RepID=A0A4R7F5X7_9FLAO|nr:DUF6770 family protein [Myroides indicus]TDS65102.1 hypothetical protein C8P70_103125 [Myroides indicus]
MKKAILFLVLLLGITAQSQVVDLQELSNGELIQSQPLYNKTQDDIYGYFFIFKKDRVDKKEFLYEYTLLDKNLNKVLSGNFVEKLGDYGKFIIVNGIYREGYITFKIDEKFAEIGVKIRTKYRILDIKENTISDAFVLSKELKKVYNEPSKSIKESTVFTFYPNSFGYHLLTPLENNAESGMYALMPKEGDKESRVRGISYFNEQLNPLWSFSFNQKGKRKQYEEVFFLNNKIHSNILVGRRLYNGSANQKLREKGEIFNTFLFFNKDTGKLISEFSPFGNKKADETEVKDVSNINIFLDSDKKVTFLNRIMSSKVKKFTLDEEKIIGFSRSEYDIATGKELSRHIFTWDKLSEHLNINEHGYIKEKGEPNSYLYLHDVILKSDGNLIFITEQYKTLTGTLLVGGSQGVKISDMILFEVDKNMALVKFQKIEKEITNYRVGIKMDGTTANQYGAFDYAGYQDLRNDDFLIYYYNKQRPENGGKKQNTLGIISYIDGNFTEQKLPLKSKDGSELVIVPAKKGYIMIVEKFKDNTKGLEIRLEKVN